jgi:FixJ family two-component response regulator
MDRDNAGIVAIVDDDNEVRDVLCVLLESAGHSVETYKSGNDFLANARLDEIACLVVDQRMPQMSGVALISTLARRGLTIPSLLITGAHDAEIAREAATLGAMTVLEKPLAPQELLRFVSFSVG